MELVMIFMKIQFSNHKKMNDCFLLPFPNTHIYLWCDMLKAQSLVWALLLLLSKLDFSQGLLPCEMPCGAAWCRRSLMGSCSSQLSVDRRFCGQDCRMTESAGWEVKAFNYSFLFSVWNSWAVSKVSASVWASKTGKVWLSTYLLTRKALPETRHWQGKEVAWTVFKAVWDWAKSAN